MDEPQNALSVVECGAPAGSVDDDLSWLRRCVDTMSTLFADLELPVDARCRLLRGAIAADTLLRLGEAVGLGSRSEAG